MGQEDVEKKISYDCLKTIVEDAIKTKNICTIEKIEDEHQLRYMQKYAELLVSKDELSISFKSYLIGIDSVGLALFAIGISYILVATADISNKLMLSIGGSVLIIIALVIIKWTKPEAKKEFENKARDIEFIHEIVLKIEERLPNRT